MAKRRDGQGVEKVGAQGFEPCPAGFFWFPLLLCERASCGRHGSALQLVINRQQTHTSSFPCNWSPQYYQAILYPRMLVTEDQFLAWRRARLRRRSFFLRHFQRWLPVFFHAREPRFMVNVPATCRHYMSASDRATSPLTPNWTCISCEGVRRKRTHQDSNPGHRLRRPR